MLDRGGAVDAGAPSVMDGSLYEVGQNPEGFDSEERSFFVRCCLQVPNTSHKNSESG